VFVVVLTWDRTHRSLPLQRAVFVVVLTWDRTHRSLPLQRAVRRRRNAAAVPHHRRLLLVHLRPHPTRQAAHSQNTASGKTRQRRVT